VEGLSTREIFDVSRLDKAVPLVPKPLIRGIPERVDYKGAVVVPLDIEAAERCLRELVEGEGVETIAISFLWSFMNPAHEQAVKALVKRLYPHVFVTASSDVAPVIGEYERAATTTVNAYVGPKINHYITRLEALLRENGLDGPFLVMQALGGAIPAQQAADKAVNVLSSGPVGGTIGSAFLGGILESPNVITTDVGGTSFDVGLIVDGEPRYTDRPVFEKYALLTPMVDITSIGAGGGSIAWLERDTGLLQVGPRSAGASPGPVCYARGGTEPTVTDADVVLGRINPKFFFGGRMQLDEESAWCAIDDQIARPLGMSTVQAAKGIVSIVDAHMADLVRKVSIESGHDPRDFDLFAYGGGGPAHVGAYAREIGVKSVVVSPYAPVFSAFGIAGADIVRFYQLSNLMLYPWDPAIINRLFDELEQRAVEETSTRDGQQRANGTTYEGRASLEIKRFIDIRYRRQTHELSIPIAQLPLSVTDLDNVVGQFEATFEQLFGKGTGYRRAGIEMSTIRVRAFQRIPRPRMREQELHGADSAAAVKGSRRVYWEDDFVETPVYAAEKLAHGNLIVGPAVVEGLATVMPIHPGQQLTVDRYGNLVLTP
jgi:N-methylhydantoinase A